MKNDFIIVIPARLASTRLPNKPLADIAGIPMIVRVAQQAAKTQASRIIVATDHQSIAETCAPYNIETVLTSPDHPSGTDRLAEVVEKLGFAEEQIIINLQGDEPLIDPELINQLALLLTNSDAPMATAAHPINSPEQLFNPNVVKVVLNQKNEALYFSRAPIPWDRDSLAQDKNKLPSRLPILHHIGLYAYRTGFLKSYKQLTPSVLEQVESLEQLRVLWHGQKIVVSITEKTPHAGIDTPEDLVRVTAYFNQLK